MTPDTMMFVNTQTDESVGQLHCESPFRLSFCSLFRNKGQPLGARATANQPLQPGTQQEFKTARRAMLTLMQSAELT